MRTLRMSLATVAMTLACSSPALADYYGLGNGKDGELMLLPGETRIVNDYARVTASPAGELIPVATTEGFEVGDLVMVWQVGGLSSAPVGNGSIELDGTNVGKYEFARIATLTATSLTVEVPLSNIYDSSSIQVVRVPEYSWAGLDEGSQLKAKPWDGDTGGIVVFFSRDDIYFNEAIVSASGAGFRGGIANNDGPADESTGCTELSLELPKGAMRGEGVAGRGFGRGNLANGGGAGVCSQGHGGGGANVGRGSGASASNAGMGGAKLGGGSPGRLVMGGGGGAGHRATNLAEDGGNGGGVIFVRAASVLGSGYLDADGWPGSASDRGDIDGRGGGGAGGTIILQLESSSEYCGFSGQVSAAGAFSGVGGNGGGGFVFLQGNLRACTEDGNFVNVGGGNGGDSLAGDGAVDTRESPFCGTFPWTCSQYSDGVCDYEANECVGCLTYWDCFADKPVCDLSTKTCAACSDTLVCPVWSPICQQSGKCSSCQTDDECAASPYGPYCLAGQCAQCRNSDDDCSGATPRCDWSQCVPCEEDGWPSCSDSMRPACNKEGPLAGHCTACTKDKPYMCGGLRPICIEATGECGCTKDEQCGAINSGLICNGSEASPGICVAGCATAPGRNGCPGGETCSKSDGSVGSCVAQPCSSASDCASPTPACDTSVEPHACVQCMTSADCEGSLVCNGDKKCVECTAKQAGNCKKSGAGAACLPSGSCGCASDADCGADRVCDTKAGKCVGAPPPTCPSCSAKNECHLPGTCIEATNACTAPRKPNGSPCSQGVCIDGTCTKGKNGPEVALGDVKTCASGAECPSGFCVDGVCCNEACDKGCHSCALPSSPGKCTPMPEGVDLRGDCGQAGTCSKTCGAEGECVDVTAGAECTRPVCTGPSTGMGPALCAGPNAACDEASALPFDCGGYACVPAFGACASMCRTQADCAPDHTCTPTGQCIPSGAQANDAGKDGGCSVSASPASSSSAGFAKVFGLLVAASILRKRGKANMRKLPFILAGILGTMLAASPAIAQSASCESSDDCNYPDYLCDTETNECVGCFTADDCWYTTPVCHPTTRSCEACTADAECPSDRPACDVATGRCFQCTTNTHCDASTIGPHCLPPGSDGPVDSLVLSVMSVIPQTGGICVECLVNEHCPATAPSCHSYRHECQACQGSGPPHCTDPSRPFCNAEGSLEGQCTECTATNAIKCGGKKPICVESLGVCGCTEDSQCGPPGSGLVCNGSQGSPGICIAGCSTAEDRNGCPSGQTCSEKSGAIGHCVAEPCSSNKDCAAPLNACDTTVEPHACVECLKDGDCPAGLLCGAGKKCVECTSSNKELCSKEGTGAACLANGTCGCASDGDCGAGKTCDTGSGKCVAGCPPCGAKNECHLAGVCVKETATCTAPRKPNGSPCSYGICIDGACTPKSSGSPGAPIASGDVQACTSGSECPSGFCVDGVCCDSACESACHSCALPFAPGLCTAAPVGVDPRGDCGDASACTSTCGPGGACIDADETTVCALPRCTDASHGTGPAFCPGPGTACDASAVVAFDCGAYACVPALGVCASACKSADDCAPGHLCNEAGRCVAPGPSSGGGDDGGCAVSASGASKVSWKWLGIAGLLAAGYLSRRSRRDSGRS